MIDQSHTGHDFCGIPSKEYSKTSASELIVGQEASVTYGGGSSFRGSACKNMVTIYTAGYLQ